MNTNQTTSSVEAVKYSTQLPPDLIKWVKLQAVERDVKGYEIIQEALEAYKVATAQRRVGLFDLGEASRVSDSYLKK